MKKTISVILAIMMMLSLFTITANAANGPSELQDAYGYLASIYFIEDDPMLDTPAKYPIFKDNTEMNYSLEGATYDKSTNTLTLTEFNRPDLRLEFSMMGEDFKIQVVGTVIFSRLIAQCDDYDTRLTFTGTGKITINPSRNHEAAIVFNGRGADCTLHVDASVHTVKFLSCGSAIVFTDVDHSDKDTLFSDGEKKITDFNGRQIENEVTVRIPGARLGNRVEHGYELGSVNQQPGTTAGMNNKYSATSLGMKFFEDENGDEIDPATGKKGVNKEVFKVEKFVYNEKLGGYIPDPTFNEDPMTEDQIFEKGFFFETQPGNEKETIEYYDYDDASGEMVKKEGYIVDNYNNGLMYVTDVDVDLLEGDARLEMKKAFPIIYNDQTQRYEITPVAGPKEFNAENMNQQGLHYRYKEEKRPFYIQELITGEYDKYKHTGEGGTSLHAVDNIHYDDTNNQPLADIFDYNEGDTVEINGKEYFILHGPSNYSLDMLLPVTEKEYGNYDWFYDFPDYIRVKTDVTPDSQETGNNGTEPSSFNQHGNQDVTGGTIPGSTTEPAETTDPTRDTSFTTAPEATTDATESTTSGAEGTTSDTTAPEATTSPEVTTDATEATTATESTQETTLYPILPVVPTIPYTTADPNATTAPATTDPNATTAPVNTDPATQPVTQKPTDNAIGGGDADEKAPIDEIKKGVSEKQVDKFVTKQKTEDDVKGSIFNLLCLRQKKVENKTITVIWNKVKGAKYYVLYGSKCGTKKGSVPPFKKIKSLTGNSYTQKKLKKGTYYKYMVIALDKNKKVITSSKNVHIVTTGGKHGNDKSITVKTKSVSLKKGKTAQISAKQIPKSKSKTVRRHRNIKYESTNKKIAKVSGKGKITAKKKGTAYIYVYAQNGLYSKVKVTVK